MQGRNKLFTTIEKINALLNKYAETIQKEIIEIFHKINPELYTADFVLRTTINSIKIRIGKNLPYVEHKDEDLNKLFKKFSACMVLTQTLDFEKFQQACSSSDINVHAKCQLAAGKLFDLKLGLHTCLPSGDQTIKEVLQENRDWGLWQSKGAGLVNDIELAIKDVQQYIFDPSSSISNAERANVNFSPLQK